MINWQQTKIDLRNQDTIAPALALIQDIDANLKACHQNLVYNQKYKGFKDFTRDLQQSRWRDLGI